MVTPRRLIKMTHGVPNSRAHIPATSSASIEIVISNIMFVDWTVIIQHYVLHQGVSSHGTRVKPSCLSLRADHEVLSGQEVSLPILKTPLVVSKEDVPSVDLDVPPVLGPAHLAA